LKIENAVCRISLSEKGLLRLELQYSSAKAGLREKRGDIKPGFYRFAHFHTASLYMAKVRTVASSPGATENMLRGLE
jgi:hypothetical protein